MLWPLGRRSYENNLGDGLEIELAKQTIIVAGVGIGISGQDGGQPVFHIQFECGGDLRHMDATCPPQLAECAPEGPAMKAPAVGVVDAVASVAPTRSRNFRQAARIARRIAANSERLLSS